MDAQAACSRLLDGADPNQIAAALADGLIQDVAELLKREYLATQYRDAQHAAAIVALMHRLADAADHPIAQSLALQTEGMMRTTAQRNYDAAIDCFERSFALARSNGDPLTAAIGHNVYVWALACVQRFDDALSSGAWARDVLAEHGRSRSLALLSNTLGAVYGRRGDDAGALAEFKSAEIALRKLGADGEARLPLALMNQGIVLRNLGQFDAALTANAQALQLAEAYGEAATVARIRQNSGLTYFVLGQFDTAYALLDQARDTFLLDGRTRDAILVDLFISDGLIQLGRFADVLEKCAAVQTTFSELGVQFEVAQALRLEGMAYAGLERYEKAEASFLAAEALFSAENNPIWQAYTTLEHAKLVYALGDFDHSEQLAAQCWGRFHESGLIPKAIEAGLVQTRAQLAQGNTEVAGRRLANLCYLAKRNQLPDLLFQGNLQRGDALQLLNQPALALSNYERAIAILEQMQGAMMVEFRSDFVRDKQQVYEQAVALCLQAGNDAVALNYAERAKSRALLTLIENRIDLGLRALRPADQPLVDALEQLRMERDRLQRRWVTGEIPDAETANSAEQQTEQLARQQMRLKIAQLEREIRQQWHRLLVRNAAYSREASKWRVQTQLDHSSLPPDTRLLNFFVSGEQVIVFVVSAEKTVAVPLETPVGVLAQLDQRLRHNFATLQHAPQLAPSLTRKARRLLKQLHDALFAPLTSYLIDIGQLILVPHGSLHYLPLHAAFDGTDYLCEQFVIRYLPGSSFLSFAPAQSSASRTLLLASGEGLANTQLEVDALAQLLGDTVQAHSREAYRQEANTARLIHIASHGEFRDDDPLFSGITLDDGTLTTLDIFNTRISASLVTLSACETGRHVVGGGDELFGLMRAFLTAGASSLLLTLWRVEDRVSAELMQTFYTHINNGHSKERALQLTQQDWRDQHPFFWAAFFLVGDGGPIR